MSDSDVAAFYANRSVLVTGATGFLGKALIEKLLRSIPHLRFIYALIRPLKGQYAEDRWSKVAECDLFDLVRKSTDDNGQFLLDKVVPINSDMMEPELGLSPEDAKRLCDDVSVIFHCAATVKFDEHMRVAVKMNVQGTQRLVRLSNKMKRLDAFVHVSTAFCNCDRTYIMEQVYPSPVPPQKLIDAVEWMSDEMIDALTPALIGRRPNTYTMTKALAETLLVEECNHLPITIVRPSIVAPTWKEPIPGWVDNYNGVTGLTALCLKGLVRVLYGRLYEVKADLIPVDVVVNMLIVAGWHRGIGKGSPVSVIHCSSDRLNPVSWGEFIGWCEEILRDRFPLSQLYRDAGGRFTVWPLEYRLRLLLDHVLPAYLIDCVLFVIGKKPIMVKLYDKIFKVLDTFVYFYSNDWYHQSKMALVLNEQLSDHDRKEFYIDIRQMNWREYTEKMCVGVRKYILREDLSTVQDGFRVQYRRRLLYNALRLGLWGYILRFFVKNTKIGRALWKMILAFLHRARRRLRLNGAQSVTRSLC